MAVVVLVSLVLAGCDSDDGPTAAQAGQTLKSDILQLLKERDARDVTVTDPGGKDIPCGDGKAKQTFAATGTDGSRMTEPYILRTAMLGALSRVGHYQTVGTSTPDSPIRVVNESTATILTLDSSAAGIYAVSGETQCLRSS
ncbi:hypothetical protein ACFFHJ_36110 [Planotetraspora thailandica]|nr:hypothetical protein [Planotetraspora thailandica]